MLVAPLALVGAAAIDRWLAALTSEAIRRAGLTQDYVSRVTHIPPSRLSDQLAGKLPFTGFCRFGLEEIRRDTEFWPEFANVLADQVGRALVPRDLGTLVAQVNELLVGQKQMLKATLPDERREERAS
jgi:hypothetical protein